MPLKQLMLTKKIEQRKAALDDLLKREEELQAKASELEQAIEEAETDEEVATVEEEVSKLEAEQNELAEKKSKLEDEIAELEGELEQINSKDLSKNNTKIEINNEKRPNLERGNIVMKRTKFETREAMLERLNRPEVREFYGKLRDAVLNKRALNGEDLLIPEVVLDRIQAQIGDYANLYNEVEVVTLNGAARAILDGAIPEAIWTEMKDPVQELASAFSAVELDGFKVGGFIPVPNSVLEDSMINLANYVEDRIARAIAKALDKAILLGQGSAQKQPTGIIPSIPAANQVTSNGTLGDILKNVSLVDTGDDAVGEVIAVMKRKTYYNHILPQTVVNTADGRQVVQGVNNPNIAGLRVVFSQYAPDNVIILGDFRKYILGQRAGVSITSSTDVRFIEDQTVFKGTARYDGKPVKPEAFAQVTIAAGA